MRKGSAGTSLGGGIVRVRQRWPEKNQEECPVCHEPRRFPCRTANRKLLYTTHTTASKQRQARRK